MNRDAMKSMILRACTLDVRAFKPGNVSIGYPHHDMAAEDFIRSAEAILDPITQPKSSVGQRIEASIEATQSQVNSNTNLGIVLLIAPIAKAVENLEAPVPTIALQHALQDTLNHLSIQDAEACYRAIRLSKAGGLGQVDTEDIAKPPTETLLQVMERARSWDQIAEAYASGYRDIFDIGVTALHEAEALGEADIWAVTRAYLEFLSKQPDTLIQRRHGMDAALRTQEDAQILLERHRSCRNATNYWMDLKNLDSKLKSQKFNPGTSADMTIASVLILQLLQFDGYNARRQMPLSQRFSAKPALAFAEKSRGFDPQL